MNEKTARLLIILVSVIAPALVVFLFYGVNMKVDLGFDPTQIPKFHAIINSLTAVFLILGLISVKTKRIKTHKFFMFSSILLSVLFFATYIIYHATTEPTSFGGEGTIKSIYYFLLITHIVLAPVIIPLVLFTFYHALSNNLEKHKKIARWTFPIWLYVTISGVLVYVLLAPYY